MLRFASNKYKMRKPICLIQCNDSTSCVIYSVIIQRNMTANATRIICAPLICFYPRYYIRVLFSLDKVIDTALINAPNCFLNKSAYRSDYVDNFFVNGKPSVRSGSDAEMR